MLVLIWVAIFGRLGTTDIGEGLEDKSERKYRVRIKYCWTVQQWVWLNNLCDSFCLWYGLYISGSSQGGGGFILLVLYLLLIFLVQIIICLSLCWLVRCLIYLVFCLMVLSVLSFSWSCGALCLQRCLLFSYLFSFAVTISF